MAKRFNVPHGNVEYIVLIQAEVDNLTISNYGSFLRPKSFMFLSKSGQNILLYVQWALISLLAPTIITKTVQVESVYAHLKWRSLKKYFLFN